MSLSDLSPAVKVTIKGLPDPIPAPPGRTLLALLRGKQTLLPFACAGNGSCGLCKVRVSGPAGPITPAEERLLRKAEIASGIRLACQVKPTADLSLELPPTVLAAREYRAVLSAVEPRTANINGLLLELPHDSGFTFEAGAFILIRIPAYPGSRFILHRPYSIASSPLRPNLLELNIRRAPNGAATTYLFDHLKPGDQVLFLGPYGDFKIEPSDRPMVFMAGGTGLSPVKSMLEHMAETNSKRSITLFFGVAGQADLFHLAAMRDLEQRLPGFRFVPTIARPDPATPWNGEKGTVTETAERLIAWTNEFDAYLCGSPMMIASLLEMLRRRNVPENHIFYDQFN